MKFVTIGAYGFTAATFLRALRKAGVDTFCDIRWRRGVRGAEYAFANRQRLESSLKEVGIRYRHFRELAPPPALRERQTAADKASGIAKRQRTALGECFKTAYCEEVLAHFDAHQFVQDLGKEAQVVALFCVEREPAACHRSLLADRLRQELGGEIIHLQPEPGEPT
jgi:uncharacterized protein (DUF488 family)